MKKLCIVGGGVTKDKAPFDSDCEIWSTASVGLGLPRCDAIFELHDGIFPDDDLNKSGRTIYMRDKREGVSKSIAFPIDKLIAKYGKHFNGTIVMMLGYAGLSGYKEISLYGIDFSSDDEYSRRNQFYWMMGHLTAQGCKININPVGYMSDTCPTYMYDDDGLSYINYKRQDAIRQIAEDEASVKALAERHAYMRGVSDTLARIERRN